jgi:hypothetical protein
MLSFWLLFCMHHYCSCLISFPITQKNAHCCRFLNLFLWVSKSTVSELGPEDTSKNIVEIIFQSSWLNKQTPICKIDRILKVHNTQKTISKFEEYRDSIKAKATKLPKKHPRCIADGNELLRFHCTNFVCSLGLNGSSNLCNSIPQCSVCSIIKNGFKVAGESAGGVAEKGILTTATSGKAHDKAGVSAEENNDKRAMLVCRVIAGRVKKSMTRLPGLRGSILIWMSCMCLILRLFCLVLLSSTEDSNVTLFNTVAWDNIFLLY